MPAPDPAREPARFPWSIPVLGLLGAVGLVVGWLSSVVPWYLGAVLVGLALALLVSALQWSRWVYPVVLGLVVALVVMPTLLRPATDAGPRLTSGDAWVSASEDVLVTLEWDEQVSTLTAWSRADGRRLWSVSEDAATVVDSPHPMPLVVGDVLLTGTLTANDPIEIWPTLGARDLGTGDELWRSEMSGAVLGVARDVLVVATPDYSMDHARPGTVQGVDLTTGEVLWSIGGVLPTAGVPVIATDSEHARWGGYLDFGQELALLALREIDADWPPEPGAQLVDPVSGEELAQVSAGSDDGVLVLGEQVLVVGHEGQRERVTGHGADGVQTWSAEVARRAVAVHGLEMMPSGAVTTVGDRVLLDGVSAALDLRTGERVTYPVRPVPGGPEYILAGSHYALTTAVTSTGYAVLVDLASGEVHDVPAELSGTGRPDAFYGGERAALLYSAVVDEPFGRVTCRVRLLDATTMTTTEHRLGECAEPAAVAFWGDVPVAETDAGWIALSGL